MTAWIFGEHGTWAGVVIGLAFLICGLAAAWMSRSQAKSLQSLKSTIHSERR